MGELLHAALDGNPGALDAGAPEFLDFLIGASLPDRQKLYRDGLDALNAQARKQFKKAFADLDDDEADAIVRPLLASFAWSDDLPKDPAAAFHRPGAPRHPHRHPEFARVGKRGRCVRDGAAALAAAGLTGLRSIPVIGGYNMAAKEYDVLIVGSGHSGGMAANILTRQGISCLMLNAGPEADFEHDRVTKAAYELPFRGFGKPGRLPHVYPGQRVQRQPMGG